jgi:hypothetical protein
VSWQSAGASGANDRESTDIGSVLVLANEANGTEKQISLDPAKIQEMVSGVFTNNGFIIIADTELNDRFNYKSSDASTSSQPVIYRFNSAFTSLLEMMALPNVQLDNTYWLPCIDFSTKLERHHLLNYMETSAHRLLPRL